LKRKILTFLLMYEARPTVQVRNNRVKIHPIFSLMFQKSLQTK